MKSLFTAFSILFLLACGITPSSQPSAILSAFKSINPTAPQTFTLLKKDNSLSLPLKHNSGSYHQQGIQKTKSGGFAVSGSARDHGYIYLTDKAGMVQSVIIPELLNPDGENYNHLGGFQVADDILAIGDERLESRAGGTSVILFYDISDIQDPVFLEHLSIPRTAAGKQTGGAVGMVQMKEHWIVLVGNWDSERLDVYQSDGLNLRNQATRFTPKPVMSWNRDQGMEELSIDQEWGSYQNINLFREPDEGQSSNSFWLIGTHTITENIQPQNRADLFHVQLSSDELTLVKKSTKQFQTAGTLFKDGAGFFWDEKSGSFEVYACERNMNSEGQSQCNAWGTP